ncbi:hypothetical protein AAH979_40890 [Plantactinospora sp. ZYX-F-223]|uniref:hypothetical protein n=1 Tax=Plantactinospora sp. ZYX-F-223 TaxID=3144103 RepID=UPI0031FDB687
MPVSIHDGRLDILRRGEVAGLRWYDVDLDRRAIPGSIPQKAHSREFRYLWRRRWTRSSVVLLPTSDSLVGRFPYLHKHASAGFLASLRFPEHFRKLLTVRLAGIDTDPSEACMGVDR